jgi:hypothetical protein
MRYFTLCLYTEGPSDRYFLERIIWRSLAELLEKADEPSEIQEDFIRFDKKPPRISRKEYIVEQIKRLEKAVTIAFVHTDGGVDPEKAEKNSCLPATKEINDNYANICGVPVVPVREMEAWALADNKAVSQATGIAYTHSKKDVQQITDPKAELGELIRRSRALTVAEVLFDIAEKCSLLQLRKLSSFSRFEDGLSAQLRRMGVLR